MDAQSLHYNKVLLQIGNGLDSSQIGDFKFLCKDVPGFTQFDMDEISTGKDLMKKLEQLDVLSKRDVDFVANLLNCVNRNDLEAELRQYENLYIKQHRVGQGQGPIAQPMSATFRQENSGFVNHGQQLYPNQAVPNAQNVPGVWGEDLTREFDIIVENVGRDWRQMARRLGLTETDIQCITEDHSRNLREQSRQALYLWKRNVQHNGTKQNLVQALRACKMNYIGDMLEGYI